MTDKADERAPTRIEQDVLAEHRSIHEMTRLMEACRDLDELLRRLEEFRARLAPHFVGEEAPDGFFDVVRSRASRHLARVEQLGKDHRAFLDEIDRLGGQARACLAGPVAEILRGAADFARRLREHEARENDLLIDAMYIDIGEDD